MRYIPHAYQSYCEGKILDLPALALWLDMGLGKTSITLSAIEELKFNRFEIRKILIVAPKRVAEATWQTEAAKWDHTKGLRFSTVLGTAKRRIKALNTPADIYVINRDNVVGWWSITGMNGPLTWWSSMRQAALRAVRPRGGNS